ncbi:MAG TPA: phosphoribosylformylglycinamidine synthase subunit PurS [Thermomicrobiales bacterium]|nr:phosphoribosylformylglycinamidine synthase subunit PurS [Thermomicrobiales bacterium]
MAQTAVSESLASDKESSPGEWRVDVLILPKDGVNDPQGEAILGGLDSLGYANVDDVRAGKLIRMRLRAATAEEAHREATSMCDRLLANPVIETYLVEVTRAEGAP